MYIFLDESGDLGFDWTKQNTSKYFVITILICDFPTYKNFKKAVKRTLKRINHRFKTHYITELKGFKTAFTIKRYFYRQLNQNGWGIYSIVLNKSRVQNHLQTKSGKKRLYNYLSRLILEKIEFSESAQNINLIVDKCKSRDDMKDFNHYIENQLYSFLPMHSSLDITHELSYRNAGLQIVDMFCWGIAKKMDGDCEWYNLFKEKIRFETIYLK